MSFNIHQKFKVVGIENLTLKNLTSLSNLYLPLIGIEAFTVYMALMHQPQRSNKDVTITHVELLNQLNLSGPRLIQAREKLEGYGLIRTFEQVLTLESQWVYEINQPIDAENFLSDKLLVKLLSSYLGDDQFEILKTSLLPDSAEIEGNNVSKGLFDIIREDNFDQIEPLKPINKRSTAWDEARQKDQPTIDFDLMFEMLKVYGVSRMTLLKNKDNLMLFKKLYAIDDLKLIRLIQGHMLDDHQIDIKGIENELRQEFQQRQEVTIQPVTDVQPKTGNILIDQANQLSPLEFLKNIREQRGGVVTASEQYAIEQLIKYGRLPNPVINIELYTLSVLQDRKTLPKAILEATYSDWAQANIKTPSEAIKYIQQRERKIKQGQQNRTSSRAGQQKHETKPDWENQPIQEVSSADQAKLDKMLAQMEAKRAIKKE
ncbi:replicative DNA helicase loader DnaB [Weissella koreensis KACC 15510]|uniref:replication initiation and membrane attachment family protein n=1 Tax=Weissella koreensis TaxID=165096 RepID=UPI0002174253|nr:DnaD domain protein [Weissella koreensis]AEJ23055.1 replicative DNA helicase loader DnaB [Weissella koreensis KACC 15510]